MDRSNKHLPSLDNRLGTDLFYGYLHRDDLDAALRVWERSMPLSRLAEFEACQSYALLEMQQCPKKLVAIRERIEDLNKMIKLDKRSSYPVFKFDDGPEPTGDDGEERA